MMCAHNFEIYLWSIKAICQRFFNWFQSNKCTPSWPPIHMHMWYTITRTFNHPSPRSTYSISICLNWVIYFTFIFDPFWAKENQFTAFAKEISLLQQNLFTWRRWFLSPFKWVPMHTAKIASFEGEERDLARLVQQWQFACYVTRSQPQVMNTCPRSRPTNTCGRSKKNRPWWTRSSISLCVWGN